MQEALGSFPSSGKKKKRYRGEKKILRHVIKFAWTRKKTYNRRAFYTKEVSE
jgi:hypothetical protein